MNFFTLAFQGISSTSIFAVRPFTAAFVVVLFGRIGTELVAHNQGASIASLNSATWILSEWALVIFGMLAVLEYFAADNEDFRPLYNDTSGFFQTGCSFVCNFGLVDGEAVLFLEMIITSLPHQLVAVSSAGGYGTESIVLYNIPIDSTVALQAAGIIGHVLAVVWGIFMAGLAWFIGTLRYALVEALENLDPHNTFGLRSIAHWAETGWTVTGALLIVLLPFLAIGVFLVTVGVLALLRLYFQHREKASRVACGQCGNLINPAAANCPHCHIARQPNAVGLFGQSTSELALDPAAHRTNLLARKRCPSCATLLKERAIQQACPTCGTVTFADVAAANTFLRELDRRLPKTLVVCFVLGLIPIVGIVPGIVYYQLSLVGSLRGYIPRGIGCLTRWGVRILNLTLMGFQAIPGFGALALPAMAFLNYHIYRGVVAG